MHQNRAARHQSSEVEPTSPPILDNQREFLSLPEVGQLLGVGRCRAWELAQSGALPAIRLGRRWYVPRRALDALVDGAIERSREVIANRDGQL